MGKKEELREMRVERDEVGYDDGKKERVAERGNDKNTKTFREHNDTKREQNTQNRI